MKKNITTVLIILCSAIAMINAQTITEKVPSPQWWLKSSLADTIDQYLYHVEGQYSYSKATGEVESEMQSGTARVAIRRSIFTNHTDYMMDKMDLNIKSMRMNYATESQAFTDFVDVDITKLFYGEGGFIWERDNTLLIKNRYTIYAGVGLNGMIAENQYLKVLAAAGSINQQYTIPVDYIDVVKGSYSVIYLRQNYKYVLDQRLSFMEDAYYLKNINHSGRYRYSVGFTIMVGIIKPVSLVFGYTYKYDRENELLGIIPKNTTETIGFNVSL
jgi:hypothetical protein